jgi:arginine exporter protein ArgO
MPPTTPGTIGASNGPVFFANKGVTLTHHLVRLCVCKVVDLMLIFISCFKKIEEINP